VGGERVTERVAGSMFVHICLVHGSFDGTL
jgi:hypothetical protein